jgi:hypothetical protein
MAGVYAPMPAVYSCEPSSQLKQQTLTTGPSWDLGVMANSHPATDITRADPENFDYLSGISYSMGHSTPGV